MKSGVVKEWTTKAGLKAAVVKCGYGEDPSGKLVELDIESEWYNGYVQVTEKSRLYGVDYNDVCTKDNDDYIDVHGGLTFSNYGHPDGNLKEGYWFGFDCHHLDDNIYRCNEDYVTYECEKLAEQLKE